MQKQVTCNMHEWEFDQIKKAARELSDPALWMRRVAVSVATGESEDCRQPKLGCSCRGAQHWADAGGVGYAHSEL
jgi:hypothetical protein